MVQTPPDERRDAVQRLMPSIQRSPAPETANLPPGSPYAGLPGPPIDVLNRSWLDRTDANGNLSNAWWSRHQTSWGHSIGWERPLWTSSGNATTAPGPLLPM